MVRRGNAWIDCGSCDPQVCVYKVRLMLLRCSGGWKKGLLLSIQKTIGGGSPAGGLHSSTKDLPSWMMIGLILSFDQRGDPIQHNTQLICLKVFYTFLLTCKTDTELLLEWWRREWIGRCWLEVKISTWGEYDGTIEDTLHALGLNLYTFQNKCFDDGRHDFFHMNNKKKWNVHKIIHSKAANELKEEAKSTVKLWTNNSNVLDWRMTMLSETAVPCSLRAVHW